MDRMSRRYVPLRPLRPSGAASNDEADGVDGALDEPDAKKRRMNITIACDSCRHRKIKCDGRRPVCSPCQGRTSPCQYRDENGLSKESSDVVVEVFRILGQQSAIDAAKIIDGLKDETNAGVIMAALRGETANIPPWLSETPFFINESSTPQELEVFNPVAYPDTSDPARSDALRRLSFQRRDRAIPGDPIIEGPAALPSSPSLPSSPYTIERQSEDKPRMCDPRLSELDIHLWTTVDIDSDVAARCISLYLETDHPLLAHFDADLFVAHLTAGKDGFCSPLLVNALLYWASQMYSCHDSTTDRLAIHFCQEAEKLWKIETDNGNDTLLNIAAAEFLSLGYLGQGRDHSVLRYMAESAHMASRMGLFRVEGHGLDDTADFASGAGLTDSDAPSTYMYTAWGVFNWLTLMSLFYHQPGVLCPTQPPRLPIPGDDELGNAECTPVALPPYMGDTFPHLCRFWSIMREVSCVYHFNGQLPWGSHGTVSFAEYKFRELLSWSNKLPQPLHSSQHGPHHVKVMHLWFHAAILDVFRPFVKDELQARTPLRTFSSDSATPKAVCEASLAQLKALIVIYRHDYPSSSFSLLWHTAMIYAVNELLGGIKDETDEDWYSYLLLCLYGYQRLNRSWRVAISISKGLLSLALRSGRIPVNAARRILSDLENKSPLRLQESIRATFMLDLEGALSEPNCATVEEVASQLQENIWLKEYTTFLDERAPN